MKFATILRILFVVGSLIAVTILLIGSPFHFGPDSLKAWADAEVRGQGLVGTLVFVAVGAIFTGIGLPRQVFALVSGYLYGATIGTAYALLAEMFGVWLGFVYGRYFGRDTLVRRFPHRVRQLDELLTRHPFSVTLAVRLFPVGNNLLVNLLAGVSSIGLFPFIAASALGHLPQTMVFAMAGSGIAQNDFLQGALAVILFSVSAGIGTYLYAKHRRSRRLFDGGDTVSGETGPELAAESKILDPN
jgi:uncharacterized membrane protein YdjX (TVP38/TMEM64 family)